MNKNIKRIIALTLILGTVSAVAPATNMNLLTTKAYAATNDDDTLDSLKLKTSSGTTIKLYSDNDYNSDNKVDYDEIEDGETYYAKTSSNTIKINTEGPSSKYVKVFKGSSKSTKGKSISNDISLPSGSTTLVVRVYSEKPDSDVRYDDDDDVVSEYKIKVKCTSSSDSSDDIFLDKLLVDSTSVSLSDSDVTYDYNVKSDVDEVTIKAVPKDDSYTVTIDNDEIDDSDNYKTKVSLNKGENKIIIEVEDDDDNYRKYTLTITRASNSSTSNSTSTGSTATTATTTTVKSNQWILVNGRWQYNDSLGRVLKNQWFFDRNYAKWYFIGWDGNMQIGWIYDGGKYYYLYTDGSMAANTIINGYKVGSDGAWIK